MQASNQAAHPTTPALMCLGKDMDKSAIIAKDIVFICILLQ